MEIRISTGNMKTVGTIGGGLFATRDRRFR
jgi:hypothetical protein